MVAEQDGGKRVWEWPARPIIELALPIIGSRLNLDAFNPTPNQILIYLGAFEQQPTDTSSIKQFPKKIT